MNFDNFLSIVQGRFRDEIVYSQEYLYQKEKLSKFERLISQSKIRLYKPAWY
jgi:hypothetical protein